MRKVLLTLLIGGVGFLACTKEPVQSETVVNDEAVTFRAHLSQTRATESSFESGDAISIFASNDYDGTLDYTNYADNSKYVYKSGEFLPASSEDAISYPDEYTSLYFYAVWPYSASYSGSQLSFSVNLDQRTNSSYAKSNLMLARTAASRSQTVDLKFDHLMAKVIINVESNDYPAGEWTSFFNNVYTDVTVNLNDGSVSTTGSQYYVIGSKNSSTSFKVLLPPQTIPSGTEFLYLQIGEEVWQWTPTKALILASGVEYEYNLTI